MTTIDIVQVAASFPERNRKGWSRQAYLDVGGPAANAAVTAALLGSRAVLHSAFGTGPLGALVGALIDQHGVTRIEYGEDRAVPVSSIWVEETSGDRTLLSTAAAFAGPQPDRVDLGDAAAVLLDGFYADLARVAARDAARRHLPVVLDCGSWRDVFDDLLPVATVAILSEEFRLPDRPDASAEEVVAATLDAYPIQLVAVSRGGDPIVWKGRRGAGRVTVPPVPVVDTLGAGDVLHGAFLHFAYRERLDLVEALKRAAAVAAGSCAHYGVRAGVEAWAAEPGITPPAGGG